ncbi:MAG: ABC transporter substrate-binding protein [Candidatus Babeliales bacterium]
MLLIKYFLLIVLIIEGNITRCFENLADLQEYASTHEEQPSSDNEDWLDPDYTTFHQQLRPNFFNKILQLLGLQKKQLWTANFFEKLLKRVVKQREKQKLSGRLVMHMRLSKPGKFYIWGDLHSAFHSLVRALEWLHKENIITEDLKINNPDHYFIFNGDAIDRSPYILETLSVLFLLLERNEKQVFYIRGKHEDGSYWQNFGLKHELRIRIKTHLGSDIPLESLISKFFNTLPLALYITTDQDPTEVIRISHSGRDNFEINEEYFGGFWSKINKKSISYYDIRNKEESTQSISIQAIINTENWMKESRTINGEPKNMFGLGLLDQEYGAMAWAILSAPIMAYQVYYNFYYDAFALLDVKMPILNSTITLYNQNIKKKDGFKKNESLNLITGVPSNRKRKSVNLAIGSTMALVGGLPSSGGEVKRGVSAAIRESNQAIDNNFHIKLVIYNDDYNAHLARKNVKRFMEEGIDIILCPVGTPTVNAFLDYVKEEKILVLFPISGSELFHKKNLVNLLNWRATYASEVSALVDYAITEHATYHFSFFYQNDAFGIGALKSAHNALKQKGIKKWADIPYTIGSTEFSKQVEDMKKSESDAIGFLSVALPTQEFIRQIGVDFFANKVLFSIVKELQLHKFVDKKGIKMYWGSVVPNPRTSKIEIVKEYRQAMDRNQYSYEEHSLEGYISASILVDMLKKIEGPITREKIKQQFEKLNDYHYKGFTWTFNAKNRTIFDLLWIGAGNYEEWIKKKVEYS